MIYFVLDVSNTTMRVYGAWIKTYYILCSKRYSSFGNIIWSRASSRHTARGTSICETGLLDDGSGCVMRKDHLISNTMFTADLAILVHHRWIHNLMKTRLGSSPNVVKPPPVCLRTGWLLFWNMRFFDFKPLSKLVQSYHQLRPGAPFANIDQL